MSSPDEPETMQSWHPAQFFQPAARTEYALLVLNQPLAGSVKTLRTVWQNALFRVAADGGANRILDAIKATPGIFDSGNPDVIIGDLDSLSNEARDYFTNPSMQSSPPSKVVHDPDQESTDFSKAVRHIRALHPGMDVVVMGGLRGRIDQGLSQLHHLYLFQKDYAQGKMYLLSEESLTFLLRPGQHQVHVDEGPAIFDKYVGIVPMREPSVITTQGLEWDVEDWRTEFGGQMSTSNHTRPDVPVVGIRTTKEVLFTISLRPDDAGAGRD